MSAERPPAAPLVRLGRGERHTVALIGNPNTGKSTLFNALTGLRQRVANYPGVTVEVKRGSFALEEAWIDVVDLPGLYSLSAHSPDERIALDVLCGHDAQAKPEAIVVLVDATNLERNLFLVSQLLELELPMVVALSMVDAARAQGLEVDAEALAAALGVPVVPVIARRRQGIEELAAAIGEAVEREVPVPAPILLELRREADALRHELEGPEPTAGAIEAERALIDQGGESERKLVERHGERASRRLAEIRGRLGGELSLAEQEAEARYDWARQVVEEVVRLPAEPRDSWSQRLDSLLSHPIVGSFVFLALMTAVFQAVFSWATPVMDLIDAGTVAVAEAARSVLPEGVLASLVADGVIAGVGAVVIFLPQILILFAFILFLEDSGYMARAAFLMDRVMRACGLSGQSFIPMLSSFACAVPGIMATRVIPARSDRLATILAAPFMTCSARLPVYAVLIAAVVPQRTVLGFLNLQGLVLLGLYLLGIVAGIATAFLLKKTLLRGPAPPFLMEMPPYRWPSLRTLLLRLWFRARVFLVRAGTVIFAVTVVVWALAYFPRSPQIQERYEVQRAEARQELSDPALGERLEELDNREAAALLEASALGTIGQALEPIFRPLGWDWRVSAAVLASFPAREVVVAALGTIYAVGSDVDETDRGLLERLDSATWPDGEPIFTLPMTLGLMVFFALCLQCGATVATIRRETGGWSWPVFAWSYMTVVAWLGAFATYRLGLLVS